MPAELITIGTLARASGCKVQTIRYYEQIGLLPVPRRSEGNQRLYSSAEIERLSFIRHARQLGFSLDAVRELLRLSDHPATPCDQADAIARRHLADVEGRIARLEGLKSELEHMVALCNGGAVSDCRVIRSLADHRLCHSEHGTPEAF